VTVPLRTVVLLLLTLLHQPVVVPQMIMLLVLPVVRVVALVLLIQELLLEQEILHPLPHLKEMMVVPIIQVPLDMQPVVAEVQVLLEVLQLLVCRVMVEQVPQMIIGLAQM